MHSSQKLAQLKKEKQVQLLFFKKKFKKKNHLSSPSEN